MALLGSVSFVFAQTPIDEAQKKTFFINLDKATIAKGYTVAAFDNDIKLSIIPGILDEATGVDVLELDEPLVEPWQLERVSEVYQFEFRNKAAYDNTKPFIIQLRYDTDTTDLKQVYYFDKNIGSWQPLPTKDYIQDGYVRAYIHLPFARVAVFTNPNVMGVGKASWYAHKGGDFAASPDFPKGSVVRVTNIANGKSVKVEINDWGPDRSINPDRVIDLDKIAFQKIASLGDGVITVDVEPLEVVLERGRVLGIDITNTTAAPRVSAAAALVVNAATGETLFAKNATTTLPLASLTKLVTAVVFLDTNPDFEKIVEYKSSDEDVTLAHVEKYESARLKIKDGDQLSVKDIFYTTMMASTNNTAETLVRISGLGREEFIRRMNEKVRSWDALQTNFIEPTGLSPQNVSSVSDYAIITKYALQYPEITTATTLLEYKFENRRDKVKKTIRNTNELLRRDFYVTGGKTGYLDEAGYCLMTRAMTQDGRDLIGVLFGAQTREQSFNELSDILKYTSRH